MSFDENQNDKNIENKKLKKKSNPLNIFLITFASTLVLISMLVLLFSPNVDVQIGGNDDLSLAENEDTYYENIDQRLHWIQMEDNREQNPILSENKEEDKTKKEESENIDPEMENNAVNNNDEPIDSNYFKSENKNNNKENVVLNYDDILLSKEKKTSINTEKHENEKAKATLSKVYIGSYPDITQAIEVQNKLAESQINISPFIKQKDGLYYIQAGSFTMYSKAKALVEELKKIGIQATIVEE